MAQELLSFNRGRISRLGMARVDVDRYYLCAQTQTNWMPRVLGSMMLRPGLLYKGATKNNNKAIFIPYIRSNSTTALLEMTANVMRVWIDEALVSRVAVSTTVTNGTFTTDLSGWTDADEAGATSAFATGNYLSLVGTSFNAAIRKQTLTVISGDQHKEHALRIIVNRGLVTLRAGSSDDGDEYIRETVLGTGTHSLAFTPTGASVYLKLFSRGQAASLVDSCVIESNGVVELPTSWAESDLTFMRWETSVDVIFVGCTGQRQYRIERRGTGRSWSVVLYQADDGPFLLANITTTHITPSDIIGDITLTSSVPYFYPTHVGALFRATSIGQLIEAALTAEDQYSDPIRITGVGSAQRAFVITRAGTFVATLTLQRSIGSVGTWLDVTTYSSDGTASYNDGLDNQIIYYRIGIKTSDYTSGEADITMSYVNGGLTGIARVTGYTSSTEVDARVLVPFGGTDATGNWAEGAWSDYQGWPNYPIYHDGRLWWLGDDHIWGSVSDAYASFDDTVIGDSGAISRTIGSGSVAVINWAAALERLAIGADGREIVGRSSALNEIMTPTNFNLKPFSTQGSATGVNAVVIDDRAIFCDKTATRLFEVSDNGQYSYDSTDLTQFIPEIGEPGFVRIVVQRKPDTRIHGLRSDGTVAVLVSEPVEKVSCWVDVETDGVVEDMFVLPGLLEDAVYYSVKRTINGGTVRYWERHALENDCRGGTYVYDNAAVPLTVIQVPFLNGKKVTARDAAGTKIGNYTVVDGTVTLGSAVVYVSFTPTLFHLEDAALIYSGSATSTVSAPHLAGAIVVVWGDGRDLGTYTLNGSGNATLTTAVTDYIVGLPYTAQYKSTKLSRIQGGDSLTRRKKVDALGLIMADAHAQGLTYGRDFNSLDNLPAIVQEQLVDPDSVWDEYDFPVFGVDGQWSSDERLCLQAASPRPCTVLAAIVDLSNAS